VTVQEGLELYTINAAQIAFEDRDKGSLEPGKLGDLVVLDADPFAVHPAMIKDIKVERTIVGGNTVYGQ
jgi:predicted amidohydrolase YtcJ